MSIALGEPSLAVVAPVDTASSMLETPLAVRPTGLLSTISKVAKQVGYRHCCIRLNFKGRTWIINNIRKNVCSSCVCRANWFENFTSPFESTYSQPLNTPKHRFVPIPAATRVIVPFVLTVTKSP